MDLDIDTVPHGGTDVDALRASVATAVGIEPFSEVIVEALAASAGRGVRVVEDGELAAYGYAVSNPNGDTSTIEIAARASADLPTVSNAVLAALEVENPVLWLHGPGDPGGAWNLDRALLKMAIGLPIYERAMFPPDSVVRGFRSADAAAVLEVNNAAFEGHAEQGALSQSDLTARLARSWVDPDGLRLIFRRGALAAFHWTKVHDDGTGEVHVLAVSPGQAGTGLGKAMTIEGLRYLFEERGCSEAVLYVDQANDAAVNLYTSLGFDQVEEHRAFLPA